MADLPGLIQGLAESGAFSQIVNDPMSQFGTPTRNYLGAQLLPERPVPLNDYTEEGIRYRSPIANDSTRYSPVQIKGSTLVGSMKVSLGNSDIGSELKGSDYDALIRLLEVSGGTSGIMGLGVSRPSMTAEAQMLQWSDKTLNVPLVEKNELQRWQAIVSASVTRTGDDGYAETVNYPNPSGHRVNAGGTWSNNSYDPYADIIAVAEVLKNKGYTISRIITSTTVRSILSLNAYMRQRVGKIIVNNAGNVVPQNAGRATESDLNSQFGSDGLPPIELYDLQYQTQSGTGYFLPRNVMVLVATTGRDEAIDRGDLEPLSLENTLGYTAIGRTTGQSVPGRVAFVDPILNKKPPRIEGQAWQTSLPVIAEPEAIAVISNIA